MEDLVELLLELFSFVSDKLRGEKVRTEQHVVLATFFFCSYIMIVVLNVSVMECALLG